MILLGFQDRTGRGPLCLDCSHVGNKDDCDNIKLCASNQVNKTIYIHVFYYTRWKVKKLYISKLKFKNLPLLERSLFG